MPIGQLQRREFITLVGTAAAAWSIAARAQQAEGVRRLGVFGHLAESDPEMRSWTVELEQGLQKLGWTVGRNLRIDYCFAAADVARMPKLANELIALTPDVILAGNTPTLAALQKATGTIPIVFVTVADPVGGGFVQSFAHPGGNITGFVPVEPPLGGKWLSVLKEIAPNVARAAVLFNPETAPYTGEFLRHAEAAAPSLRVELTPAPIHNAAEIEAAVAALARSPGGGLIIMADSTVGVHRPRIITLASEYRLPAIYPYSYWPKEGGLMSYGTVLSEHWRQAASYINAILRGAKPTDLPVQAATKHELVINLKTAKALGLELPLSLLIRVDEVIE
jgi:putative tryptophan/tyrosine transport system substrate-binding protein